MPFSVVVALSWGEDYGGYLVGVVEVEELDVGGAAARGALARTYQNLYEVNSRRDHNNMGNKGTG